MRTTAFIVLLAVLGAAFAGGTVYAQVPAGDGATPMGGMDEDERVRERERMRFEYEQLREARAKALREAREETAGAAGEQIPGWKGTGEPDRTASLAAAAEEAARAAERDSSPVRPLTGTPKYLLYLAIGMLGVVIVVRFRKGR
jgi:hypothetical protein